MIQEQAIVIVNFDQGGMLHDEEMSILANFWLTEVFSTVVNCAPHERSPAFVCCDEMPSFRASAPFLSRMLNQIRKMQLRFIGAFQGIDAFEHGADEPLVKAMQQCGTTFVFRHKGSANAKYFGEMIQLPQNDPLQVKYQYYEDQPYSDEHREVTLVDYGETETKSVSQSDTETWRTSIQHGKTHGTSHTTEESFSDANSTGSHSRTSLSEASNVGGGESQSEQLDPNRVCTAYNSAANQSWSDSVTRGRDTGESSTHVQQSGRSESTSTSESTSVVRGEDKGGARGTTTGTSKSHSITYKKQLVPVTKWRKLLKFIEFFSTNELVQIEASRITKLNIGEAILLSGSGKVEAVRIPLPQPLSDNAVYQQVVRQSFLRQLTTRVGFQTIPDIVAYRKQLARLFAEALKSLPPPQTKRLGETESPPKPKPLDDDSDLTI